MTTKQIFDLPADATPAIDDVVEVQVDSNGGTSSKSTIEEINQAFSEYGCIYVQEGEGNQGDIDDSYTKVNQFAVNGASSANVTPDQANDKIAVGVAGDYWVEFSISMTGSSNQEYHLAIFLDEVETHISTDRKIGTGTDVGSASAGCVLPITAGQEVSLRVKTVGSGPYDFGLQHGLLGLHRLG